MIKLTITGSHSVGKTSLLGSLQADLKNRYEVVCIPEAARFLIKKRFKMNTDITEYGIISYALYYLHHERTSNAKIYLSDRSVIDVLAYISVNQSMKIRKNVLSLIEEIVSLEAKVLNMYVYLPIEFPLQYDNVRPADEKYRTDVDGMIRNLLDKYKINYLTARGSLKDRTNQVLEKINDQLSKT